ncbi:hypothetical protein M408DRAFT_331497 [Serendipita vermifera MAFF 305830]|uniref:GST N-terminal domain-containing protein n=1 Tax=Serendipita vermifera MAFF 305830 TaxID=933852 RepID=A0A0C2X6W7_SERVB|nr:hypothetical protein M408DRAFT_331497 [Serendipita vermifera MAFF 305830]
MSRKITFYDIASRLNPQAWSPNTWKTRFVLNYKRIPYETVYVSYPDIAQLWQTLGLSPLAADPKTFLPLISVPSTDGGPPSVIADSFDIALYLDYEFPETPAVIPPNTGALQSSWALTLRTLVVPNLRPLILPQLVHKLDERGATYFRQTREKTFGMKLEELAPPGPKRDEALKKLERSLNDLFDMLKTNRGHDEQHLEWVMGAVGPTFADFALGGILTWCKVGGDQQTWDVVSSWNGGRWARHLDKLQPWSDVV